jgi:hypothetical protein
MATTFKAFLDDDIVSTRTLLHENIPLTGTIISGSSYNEENIKSFTHGMFQAVYDYPVLSSSANHLLDLSVGLTAGSPASSSITNDVFLKKKINIYNQMAQVLVGHDATGSIFEFDRDANPATTGDKFSSMYFMNFSRLLVKDEIKKGSFELLIGAASSSATPFTELVKVSDASGSTNYFVNSPTGEYGLLYANNYLGSPLAATQTNKVVGFVFYQAGVVALSPTLFTVSGTASPSTSLASSQFGQMSHVVEINAASSWNIQNAFQSGSINQINQGLRKRIANLTFNNTTELNSTIHFCRINHNEFNYSSNPTYLQNSKIRVKNTNSDAPVSYITTVGLYSPDNELLAVAKVSEPLKKDPTQEMILRVRLDY